MKHQEFLQHLSNLSKKPINLKEALVDDPVEPGKAKAPGDAGGRVAKAAYDSTLGAYGDYWNREMSRVSATDAAAAERMDREIGELEQAYGTLENPGPILKAIKSGEITGKQASEMAKNWKKRAEANQAEDKVQNWFETGERVADTAFNVTTDALTFTPAFGVAAGLKGLKSAVDTSKAYAGVPTYKSKEENIQSAVEQGVGSVTLGGIKYIRPITQYGVGLGKKAAEKTVEKVAATKLGKPVVDTGRKVVQKTEEITGAVSQKAGQLTQQAKEKVIASTPQAVKDAAARAASTARNVNQRFAYDPAGAAGGAIIADFTTPEEAGMGERLGRIGTGMFIGGKIAPGLLKPLEAGFKQSSLGRGVAAVERTVDTALGMAKNIHKMPGAMVDQAVRDTLKTGRPPVTAPDDTIERAERIVRGLNAAEQAAKEGRQTAARDLAARDQRSELARDVHKADQAAARDEAMRAAEAARDEAARLRRNELIKKGKIKPEPPTEGPQ